MSARGGERRSGDRDTRSRQGFLFDRPPETDDGRAVTVAVETKLMTDKGLLVTNGVTEAWLPLSLIEEVADIEIPHPCQELTIPEWLAHERGLI